MQLSIFDNLESIKTPDDIITEKANNLLKQLNEGRNKKRTLHPSLLLARKRQYSINGR